MSQCQYPAFVWRHNAKLEKTVLSDNGEMSDQEIDIHGCYSLVKIALAPICACKPGHARTLVKWFANDFHSWLHHSWKSLANHLICDPEIIIHGNFCIILYIHTSVNLDLWPDMSE